MYADPQTTVRPAPFGAGDRIGSRAGRAVLGAMISAAQAAPVGALKQFRVPTDNSQPRYLAEGSDGNFDPSGS